VEIHPCRDFDYKDGGDKPVDCGAERGPPPGVGDVVMTLLAEVL
jgi:hypothetical protein